MERTILIFISRILCYESNHFFIAEMSKELKKLGYEIEICEIEMEESDIEEKLEQYIGKKFRAIIDFNSRLQRLELDSGERYLDQIDAPFYNYIVDHPLYHHPVINIKLKNSNIIAIDRAHCEYVKEYYPDIKKVIFMPLGAMKAMNIIPYEERRIDVLFSGTYSSAAKLLEEINFSDLKEELCLFVDELKANTNVTQEQALRNILDRTGEQLSKREFRERLNAYYVADKYVRAYYREKIIQELLNHQINVTVYGYGWENFKCNNKEYLHINQLVSFPVSLEIIAASKIVLNIMPWFKDGIHDRVLSAIVNKAVCVTETSRYVEENFADNENIVLYSLDHIEQLPDKIQALLDKEEKAKSISECGYDLVNAKHMWKNRIEENIDKII
ncbi:glycosyltransferase [Lachnotalea glycerini]|uniref:Glycosyltransferase family 1 protein n=1 Tax=Lachnotalea glycerini TaxID=1763509 RepID=A0A371JCJ6_9FIRM|nr:glycosyltransferase [Lachnotalea glycerini]RDY30480.1 glycosyltransferase family 1 protein [Lachnotalea glycerini]